MEKLLFRVGLVVLVTGVILFFLAGVEFPNTPLQETNQAYWLVLALIGLILAMAGLVVKKYKKNLKEKKKKGKKKK